MITIFEPPKPLADELLDQLTAIWESSVRDTHTFLAESYFLFLKEKIRDEYLCSVHIAVVTTDEQEISGFAGTFDGKLEMLFLHADHRGKGIGKKLLQYTINHMGVSMVDVNEQNEQAVGFYKKAGFVVTNRSETDGLGKPYPLLHMTIA